MINHIDEIFEQDEQKRKLNINDGKWQNCNYYYLERKSSNLFIRTLDKKFTDDAKEGLRDLLLNLLFDQSKYGNRWNISQPFDSNDFERCVKYDFIGFKEVKNIINRFDHLSYPWRIDSYYDDIGESFKEMYANGDILDKELIPDFLFINKILCALSFVDDWDHNEFFIETPDKWVLISWYAVC